MKQTTPAAVAVLPTDNASVVYNRANPTRMITKHTDGELVKLTPHDGDAPGETTYAVDRRTEFAVSWWNNGGYRQFTSAYSAVADRQAFGFRFNEAPRTLAETASPDADTASTVEIEPQNLGAIIIEGWDDLPLTLHTTDGDYWRLRQTPHEPEDFHACVVERLAADATAWETVDTIEFEFSPVNIIDIFADYAGVTTTEDISADGIQTAIDQQRDDEYTQAEFPETDRADAEEFGMQTDTLDYE